MAHGKTRSSQRRIQRQRSSRHLTFFRPVVERLEQRRLLASYVVDSAEDSIDANDNALTLREAIESANASSGFDTIEFSPSLRGQTITLQPINGENRELRIADDVSIVGPGANLLTIDASGRTRVFFVQRSELLLSGVTLTGGKTSGGATDNGLGGGIYNDSGAISLDDVSLVGNRASGKGGAIFNAASGQRNAVVTINNSLIDGNTANQGGGAIGSSGGVVQIFNSTLLRNSATNAGGGAIAAVDTRVALTGTTVARNQATGDGGGVAVEGGSLNIRESTIDQNVAGRDAGGFFADAASVVILRSSIVDNTASRDGGGLFIRQNDVADVRIDTSTISQNTATGFAGGVYADAANMGIFGSTIAHNVSDSDDDNSGSGGGIHVPGGRSLLMHNTLIAGNLRGAQPSDISGTVDPFSLANLVADAASAGGLVEDASDTIPNLIGRDPNFVIGSLAANGGPTQTHELPAGSPAIDAGDRFEIRDSDGNTFGNTIDLREVDDQRGITRLRDPFNDKVDIGAYERRTDVDNFYAGDFAVSGVSQIGLDFGLIEKVNRFVIPFDTGDVSVGGFVDIIGAPTGLEIDFGASGEAGVEVGFFVDSGSINASYMANLSQSYQEPEAVGPVRLSSDVAYSAAQFNTTSPGFGAYADLILNLQGYIDAQGCLVGACGNIEQDFAFDFGQELAAINRNRDGEIRINEERIPIDGGPGFQIDIGPLTKIPPLKGTISGECSVDEFFVNCKETLTAELDDKLVGEKLKDLADLGLEFELAEFRQSFPPSIKLASTSSDADGVLRDESSRSEVSPCADSDGPLPPGVDRTFLGSFCVQAGNLALIAAGKPPLAGPISYSIGLGEGTGVSLLEFNLTPLGLELGPALFVHQEAVVTPVSTITYSFDQPVTIRPSGGGPSVTVTEYTIPAATASRGSFLDVDFTGKPIQVDATWTRGIDLHNLIDLEVTIEGLLTILDLGIDSDVFDFDAIGLDLDPDPLLEEEFRLLEFPPIVVFDKTVNLLRERIQLESFTIGETFTPSLNVTRKGDSGAGSLRNAIESARLLDMEERSNPNVPDVPHSIYLDGGTYQLDLSNADNASIGGDLDIVDTDLSIIGAGSGETTIIVNGSLDRIFDVKAGSSLNLVGVTLINGNPDLSAGEGRNGGSIRNLGQLRLEDVFIRSADAGPLGKGGGIFNDAGATLSMIDSKIQGSSASLGGAIFNGGTLDIWTSTIGAEGLTTNSVDVDDSVGCSTSSCNRAEVHGGGIYNAVGATVSIVQSTLADNTAQFGGGFYNSGDATVLSSTIAANNAVGQQGESTTMGAGGGGGGAGLGGGLFNEGGTLVLSNSTISLNQAIGGDAGIGSRWNSSAANNELGGRGGGPAGGQGGNLVGNSISTAGGLGSGGGGGGTGPAAVARNRGSVSSGSSFAGGGGGAGYRHRLAASDTDNFADTNGNLGGGGRGGNSIKGSRLSGDGGGGGGVGGGIFHRSGSVTILSSTISENSAAGGQTGRTNSKGTNGFGIGGGIFVLSTELPSLSNTIIANNLADLHPDVNGGFPNVGNNLVESRSIDQTGILYTGQANALGQPFDLFANLTANRDGQSGILQGDVTVSDDPSAARFGGSSIQFGPTGQFSRVQLPGSSFLGSSFTLAAMVRTDSVGFTRLFSAFDGSGAPTSDELLLDFDTDGSTVNGLRFRIGSQSVSPTSRLDFSDGLYHHLAATYDSGQVRIYLDGQVVGTGTIANQNVRLTRDLLVGEDSGGNFNEQLQGNVDDVLVLQRAMTSAEIQQLASEGAVAFFAPPVGNLSGIDPQLAALGQYGGPTLTHALLPGSPAIGSGDANLLPRDDEDNLLGDQRGFERINADIGSTAMVPDTLNLAVDGSADPFSLRQAITVFNVQGGSNSIRLGPGTYSLSDIPGLRGPTDSAQFGDLDVVGQTLRIVGSGAGQTIIDASLLGDRVFDVHNGATLILSNVTIVAGSALAGESGGGIRNAGDLVLEDAEVSDNSAATGGGIYNSASGNAVITRSTVSNNESQWGAGIHSLGTLGVSASSFTKNSAVGLGGFDAPRNIVDLGGQGGGGGGGGGGLGGAIFLEQGETTLSNVTIALNQAVGGDGGDGVDNSQNRPFGPGGDGGGIGGGDAGDPNSLQGQVADDGLFGGGGGGGGSVTGTTSPIGGNGGLGGGGGGGGAIVESSQTGDGGLGGSPGLAAGVGGTGSRETNPKLSAGGGGGGGGGIGGAIFLRSGNLTISSSTIVENRSKGGRGGTTGVTGNNDANQVRISRGDDGTGSAGGVFVLAGTVTVTNTIVAQNSADASTDVLGVFVSMNGNLIGESAPGSGFSQPGDQTGSPNAPLDPGLAAIANNGGSTLTAVPIVGSLAIDRGGNTVLSQDQRGEPRVEGGVVDVGAVETKDVVEQFVLDVESDVLGVNGLRQAIINANNLPGHQIIDLGAGNYTLSISGIDELDAATGDLNVTDDLTIIGIGADRASIDATSLGDRVFNVASGVQFSLSGVTVLGGTTSSDGGGLLNAGTTMLSNVELRDNVAAKGGGISNQGILHVVRSTVAGNTATSQGGGIHHAGTRLRLINSTLSSNQSGTIGGGLFAEAATLVVSSTIVGNTATEAAGGLVVSGTGENAIQHTIIAGNTAPRSRDLDGSLYSRGFNLVGDADGVADLLGSDLVNLDPLLGVLENNGGATRSHFPLQTSPALNAGGSGNFASDPEFQFDQRGSQRIIGSVDIGAVEVRSLVVDRQLDDLAPGSLRAAIRSANSVPGFDAINLGPGVYVLTLVGSDEDDAASGDLDILDNLAIRGSGADQTIIDATALGDRAFDILGEAQFELFGVTVRGGGNVAAGGAIRNVGTTTLSRVSLTENIAADGGAVANLASGSLNVIQSTIHGNTATNRGGGIATQDQAVTTIINSTISTNRASDGGGIANASPSATRIEFSTVALNQANSSGGGLVGTYQLWHSIVASNLAPSGPDVFGSIQSDGYNLIQDLSGATGLTAEDMIANPLLGPLQPNGGPLLTHQLLPGSPAIDAGDEATLAMPKPVIDQRDYSRQQSTIDIGALETQIDFTISVPTGDSTSVIDVGSGSTRIVVAAAGIDTEFPTPGRSIRIIGGGQGDEVDTAFAPPGLALTIDVGGGDDVILASITPLTQILAGDGYDILRLPGAGIDLDLGVLAATAIQDIEEIDLRGIGDNVLTLTSADVRRLSSANALTLHADTGDTVNVGDGWTLIGTEVVDGRFARLLSQNATLRLIGPADWQNPVNFADVNNSGDASALDALLIINELGAGAFSNNRILVNAASLSVFPDLFFDVTGDDRVTALDALRVINALARQSASSEEVQAATIPLYPLDVFSKRDTNRTTREKTNAVWGTNNSISVKTPANSAPSDREQATKVDVTLSQSNNGASAEPSESIDGEFIANVDTLMAETFGRL